MRAEKQEWLKTRSQRRVLYKQRLEICLCLVVTRLRLQLRTGGNVRRRTQAEAECYRTLSRLAKAGYDRSYPSLGRVFFLWVQLHEGISSRDLKAGIIGSGPALRG
jgi:hypothetical protein